MCLPMTLLRLIFRGLYGFYAWLVTAIVLPPLWGVSISLPSLPLRRGFATFTMRSIAGLIGIPIRVEGLENLPAGAAVVAANHISYLDGPMMLLALPPRFSFVVKAEASKVPVVAMLLRRMGCTFVTRDSAREGSKDTRQLMRKLDAGLSLGFFPEGHIQRRPGLQPFRLGAFLIAAHCGAPVVPAVIRGTRGFLARNEWWPKHSRIQIRLLPPIAPDGSDRAAALRLRDQAYAAILAHCEEPATGRPVPGPGSAGE
jgi:1-acyl-sn-glycerol-3-phosphate acyltransferase